MSKMAWFMGAFATLRDLGALREKSSERMWRFVLESSKHGMRRWFSSGRCSRLGKG